jgi:hypothetical protein
MNIKLGSQITQYFHWISPLYQDTYLDNQQLPYSLWTPLYDGHQTSVSNYSVISTEFDIHTRTLLNYGQIVDSMSQTLMPLPKFRGPSPFMSARGAYGKVTSQLCCLLTVSGQCWPICGHLSIKDPILQSHITQSFPLNLTSIPWHFLIMDKLTVVLHWQPSLVDISL